MKRLTARIASTEVVRLLLVVLAAIAVRGIVTARGWFYWDDLTLVAEARTQDLPSLLFTLHDGHLMPAAWVIVKMFTPLGLNWPVVASLLIVSQAVTIASVGYAAWRISSHNAWWVTALYALVPLTLPTYSWAAAALTTLPLHCASAVWLAHGWLYVLHRRQRDVVIVILAVLWACIFTERAILLAPLSVALLWCWAHIQRRTIGAVLPLALSAPAIVWGLVYTVLSGALSPNKFSGLPSTFRAGYLEGFLPSLIGGPLRWERWAPGPPFAAPPEWMVWLAPLLVVALVIWVGRTNWLGAVAIGVSLAYPVLPLLGLSLLRSGPHTAVEIAQTLRHFSEVAVPLALTLGVLVRRQLRIVGSSVLALWGIASLISTVTYAQIWSQQPARDYVATLRGELERRGEPVLDQDVPLEVLLPVTAPYNRVSSLMPEAVATSVEKPVVVGGDGTLLPAGLVAFRATSGQPGCVQAGGQLDTLFDGPLLNREWTLRLNYLAEASGTATVRLDGRSVDIPLQEGLHQTHVRVIGGGQILSISADVPVCLARSDIGVLAVR